MRAGGRTAVGLAVLVLSVIPASAGAAELPPFFTQLPGAGEATLGVGANQLSEPRGIVSSPDGTRVYVSDSPNNRVSVYGAWGQFREAFGWGVKDGVSAESQNCINSNYPEAPPHGDCKAGIPGAGLGQFSRPEGIAVDSSGDLWVVDIDNHRVQKLSPTGEFLAEIGGGVNLTSGGNVCPRPGFPGDACSEAVATTGNGPGQFEGWPEGSPVAGQFIAVGAGDSLYVGSKNRIEVFEDNGVFKEQLSFASVHASFPEFPESSFTRGLAYDAKSGDLYVSVSQAINGEFRPYLYKLTPAGAVAGTLEVHKPAAIATEGLEGEGNVFAIEPSFVSDAPYSFEPHLEPEVLEFDATGKRVGVISKVKKAITFLSLGTSRAGTLYVGQKSASEAFVSAFGPPPFEIEVPPAVKPTITEQYAVSGGSTNAVVRAKINPHFYGLTSFHVEFGTEPCGLGGCVVTPEQQLGGGEKGSAITSPPVALGGLAPNTTYHFRFVATSGTKAVKGVGVSEEEGTFRTRIGTVEALPDDRSYEKVSPADKNNGEAGLISQPLGGGTETAQARPLQASPDGDAISFASFAVFGEAGGGPAASQYLSRRGADGWGNENITPAARGFSLRDPIRGLSEDLGRSAVVQFEPALTAGATEGIENIYLREEDGGLKLLSPAPIGGADQLYCISLGGASADFSRIFFLAQGRLLPEVPNEAGQSLYEWSETGGLALVSVLPNGTPASPAEGGFSSKESGFGSRLGCLKEGNALNAVSADGQTAIWRYGKSYEGISNPLFARLSGTSTIELDMPEAGAAGPAGGGTFWAAAKDGSAAFFTAAGKLTPGAKGGDLYRYDFTAPEGSRLTDVSAGPEAAQLLGLLGASEDGRVIYFAAKGALTGAEENSEGEKAQVGRANIYRWAVGEGLSFVAAASPSEDESNEVSKGSSPWGEAPYRRTARVSTDGSLLAFASTVALTGFDNRDQSSSSQRDREVFLYDASDGQLRCASCSPIGARPIGPASLPIWTTPFSQPRDLSEAQGGRLFFQSKDALAERDTNGRQDVYEFELPGVGGCTETSPTFAATLGGCQDLISSGESTDDAVLDDASASGDDVFFATRQRLRSSDQDDHYDIYDARVGGGFAEASEPAICTGEGCRPAVTPPALPSPGGTGIFQGFGNEKQTRKHHKKKHHTKKGKGKKHHAKRNRGGRP